MARNQPTACPNGTQCPSKKIVPQPVQFFLNKSKVETNVVGYENSPFSNPEHISRYIGKAGRILHHFIRNTRQVANEWRNWTTGVKE